MIRVTEGVTGAWAEVEYLGVEGAGDWRDSARFAWRVGVGSEVLAEGADLRSGIGNESAIEALRSLGSFLGAFDEAHRYGGPDSENRDLFPEPVAEVAGELAEAIMLELGE